jgi:hypothetical protein
MGKDFYIEGKEFKMFVEEKVNENGMSIERPFSFV